MNIDFKFAFLILVVLCQLYCVDAWWGGGSRSMQSWFWKFQQTYKRANTFDKVCNLMLFDILHTFIVA
jgi:hypothetical protein